MPSVPEANTTELPASEYLAQCAGSAEIWFARAERKFINRIDSHVVANIKNAGPFVTGQAVHIFRTAGFASSYGPIVDRMRPGVPRFERETLAESALERESQSVIGARPDVTLAIDGTKRVRIVGIGIILVKRPHTVAVDGIKCYRSGAEVYGASRKQANPAASYVLGRREEIRRQLMLYRQSPLLRVQVAASLTLQSARM